LELDWSGLTRNRKSTVAISLASILFPFLFGLTFASNADAVLMGPAVSRTAFALFVGVAMSVTAFPVLARILADTGLRPTPMGNLSLACAAINDLVAWSLLAWVICLAQAKAADGVWTLVFVAIYLASMFWVVRPLLKKTTRAGIAVLLILLAVSASTTTLIGLHAILGAFLIGAIIPKENALAGEPTHRAEGWVRVWLLPVFFAYTGLRTQIGLLNSPHDWWLCAIVIALATAGKLGGTTLAARWCGLRWHPALMLGVLMNTRGLVELIVLNAGFELKLISAKLFTMLVVMALVTTLMTCPLLQFFWRKETAPAEHA
jgi:Kef-type K+ transport system membrane component KefB